MHFEPIQRESSVDACARALREAILGGSIAPGERLPPERRLAESFGVNRVTVRGALGQLAAAGLVRVRQGSGYVVRDYRTAGGPDLILGLAELAADDHALREVIDDLLLVRRHLARGVLERVSEVPPEIAAPRIEAIREAIDGFAQVVEAEGGHEALAAADLTVLAAIVDATGSAVLRLCLNPVLDVVGKLPALRRVIYSDPVGNLMSYQVLLSWLATPDRALIDDVVAELARRDALSVASITLGDPA